MVVSLSRRVRTPPEQRAALAHVLVVGGSPREWANLGDQRWSARVGELGAVAAGAGARWLTLRAYAPDATVGVSEPPDLERWDRVVEARDGVDATCTVIVDPCADGRRRFADAIRRLPPNIGPDDAVSTRAVAEALYAPARAEPDLVLVLGPSNRLPPSLVWELAYGELVFADATWDELAADHLAAAITAFASRQRRFGGLS